MENRMSEHDNIAIVRRMYTDVFDQQQLDLVDERRVGEVAQGFHRRVQQFDRLPRGLDCFGCTHGGPFLGADRGETDVFTHRC